MRPRSFRSVPQSAPHAPGRQSRSTGSLRPIALLPAAGITGFCIPRIGALLLALLVAGSTLFCAPAATLWAQAEEAPAADAVPASDPAPAPAAAADSAPGESTSPPNYLEWAFDALGWGYSLIFLFLSFTLVALIVMNMLTARRENVCPMALVEAFEANVNERKLQEAYELAKSDESFLGQVLSAGLARLSSGYSQVIEAMQEVGEEENMKLEHRLSYMALIGTISPMIGLFGTVHGMINSFQVIATSPTAPKPTDLAQGISTALFTTLIGLFIAIPAIAAYNLLRNRVSRLVLEVGILSDNLMSRLEPLAGKRS
jgi:biopolymer transport protein ExbB